RGLVPFALRELREMRENHRLRFAIHEECRIGAGGIYTYFHISKLHAAVVSFRAPALVAFSTAGGHQHARFSLVARISHSAFEHLLSVEGILRFTFLLEPYRFRHRAIL